MRRYRIMNKDGLFSTGGLEPQWTKEGKFWKSVGHIKSHLKQFEEWGRAFPYHAQDVIIEYQMIVTNTEKEYFVSELIGK